MTRVLSILSLIPVAWSGGCSPIRSNRFAQSSSSHETQVASHSSSYRTLCLCQIVGGFHVQEHTSPFFAGLSLTR
jgi:hypothetical protein